MRIQEFLSERSGGEGWGGGGEGLGSTDRKTSDNIFYSPKLISQFYRGGPMVF